MKHCVEITRFARTQKGFLDFAYRLEALLKRYEVLLVSDHPGNVPRMAIAGVQDYVFPDEEFQVDGSAIFCSCL